MKRWMAALLAGLLVFACTGCTALEQTPWPVPSRTASVLEDMEPIQQPDFDDDTASSTAQIQDGQEEEEMNLEIIVGDTVFSAELYQNEAARTLWQMLPLTLSMNELNGNEKYSYLSQQFPTNPQQPAGIQTGDLMLFGADCLVLFYDSFPTSYRYTPLGRVEDPAGLAQALGEGNVTVQFLPSE